MSNNYARPYLREIQLSLATDVNPSTAVNLEGWNLVGIVMPTSDWTAADLTFQVGFGGTSPSYHNLYGPDGGEYTVSAAADRFIHLDPADFAGIGSIKIRSGTSGTAVAQAAARTLYLIVRDI